MSDHNEPCGCEESQLLHQAIRDYMENNDDTGIRNMYKLGPVRKLMLTDMSLSIEDRRQIRKYITKIETENECLMRAQLPTTHMIEGIPIASAVEGRKLKQALKSARVRAVIEFAAWVDRPENGWAPDAARAYLAENES